MTLYRGHVFLGQYADQSKDLEKYGPLDPFHFFVGASSLVLRLEVRGDERANRFIVLRRLGDQPEDPLVRKSAETCRERMAAGVAWLATGASGAPRSQD